MSPDELARWNLNGHVATAVGGAPLTSIPTLNSRPGAAANLYLDFDGEAATSWISYDVPVTPAFSQDSDVTTFSPGELASVQEVWSRVSEIYSPFNVNVSTAKPGTLVAGRDIKVIIGGNGSWTNAPVSGIAWTNTFTTGWCPRTVYIFPDQLGQSTRFTAEIISHEVGHHLGLSHQALYDASNNEIDDYNPGTSAVAPIMGVPFNAARATWWSGFTGPDHDPQNDLSMIAAAIPLVADEAGGTIGSSATLVASNNAVSQTGVITSSADADYYKFTTPAGTVSFAANVAAYGAMLDAKLELRDASGTLVASANTASLSETLSATVAAGTYYVVVASAGNYGDIGQYTLTGTLPSASAGVAVDAGSGYSAAEGGSVNLAANLLGGTAASYAWDLDGDGVYGETGASAARGNESGANVTLSAAGLDGPSTYVVGVRLTGTDGSTATDTANVAITNVAPTLAQAASPVGSINEGSPVTLSFLATDPGADTISQWTINWGDGSAVQTLAGTATSATKTFADNGTYTVTLTATDEDGSYATTRTIAILNVAPTLALTPPAALNEGSNGTFTFAATDPGADVITGWSINWGDGTAATSLAGSATSATKKYADNGTYTVTLTATDGDGSYSITRSVTVLDVAPTLNYSVFNTPVEGATVGITFSVTDPGADAVTSWVVNFGDGTASVNKTGALANASHFYAGSGAYTVTLTAYDEDGPHTFLRTMNVADVAPTLAFNSPSAANEGSTVNVTFGATDQGNDVVGGWEIDWGDNRGVTMLDGTATTSSRQYIDNGVYTITLKASQPDGVFTTTRQITINNVAPTVSLNTVATVPEGASFPINFSATDPGYDTISKWVVNWGDGTAAQTLAGTATTATKTYANRGTYTITLVATDEDGSYTTTRSVVASAVAPTLTFTAPSAANEGSPISVAFSAAIAGGSPITGWKINWGDGSAVQTLAANATGATKTYADDGSYSILLTATDSAGSYSTARTVVVGNVAPTLTLTAPATVAEGASFSINFGKTDPGADTVSQWLINWGDGTTATTKPGSATSATKTYAARGTYTITLAATDEDGNYATTRSIVASAVAPTLTLNAPSTANEGAPVNVAFAAAGVAAITGWSIDWGDGSAAQSLAAGASGASRTYADNGAYTVTLTATDSAGSYPITKSITVNNVAPTLTLTGPATADEGDATTFDFGVTDPGADALTSWSINWGDGSAVQSIGLGETGATKTFADDGDYTVRLTATDEDGTYSVTRAVHVNNVPPTLVVSASAEWVASGATFTLSVAGRTAGVASWLVDWGDGHADTFDAATRNFTYAYTADGAYSATVSAIDGDGNASVAGTADVEVLAAPSATITSIETLTDATSQILVDVTYASPRGYALSAFKRTDLSLGGFGTGVTVKMVSATSDDDGLTWSVRYSLNRGAAWSFGDDGSYSVGLKSSAVKDALGRSVGATAVSFEMHVRPADAAGNDLATAKQLGEFTPGRVRTMSDAVGPWDKTDLYRFKVGTAGTVKIKLSDLSDKADLKVMNNNGEQIASSSRGGSSTESLELSLPKGWIYVRVYDTKGEGTTYSLRLDLAGKAIAPTKPTANDPAPTAGPTQLGAFHAGRARSVGGTLAGGLDDGEYYRFRLGKRGAVRVELSELSANADVELLDGLGRTIATSSNDVDFDESISMTLDGGWYFVHVMPHAGQAADEGATGYSLRVAA